MWIAISGPPGTSKNRLAEILARVEGYTYLEELPDRVDQSWFLREVNHLSKRSILQSTIEAGRKQGNFLTVRTIWDGPEVFAKVGLKREAITEEEFGIINLIYKQLTEEAISPPDAFIYLRCESVMSSLNRMALQGRSLPEETFMEMCAEYDRYRQKLAVPVIEIAHNDNFDAIVLEAQYALQSLKTTGLSDFTIWKKGIFK